MKAGECRDPHFNSKESNKLLNGEILEHEVVGS